MATETYMNVPKMQEHAKWFAQQSQMVKALNKRVENIMVEIRNTAFLGSVGNAIYSNWSSQLRPQIDKFDAKLDEISRDLFDAIDAYQKEDYSGSLKYVGGGKV